MSEDARLTTELISRMTAEPVTRLEQFDVACDMSRTIFVEKNKQYSDAILETGLNGSVTELVGLASRLKELVLRNPKAGEDVRYLLADILADIHNYAAISMIWVGTGNWRGQEHEQD
jgi:hypothetical protein